MRPSRIVFLLSGVLLPAPAQAHSFGQIYTLPLPIWLYLWGAAAALVASFVVVALFAAERRPAQQSMENPSTVQARRYRLPTLLLWSMRLLSVCALALCILTGWLGTSSPYGNFNMTFFWIVFMLGLGYATALVGDLYALINPWRQICDVLKRVVPQWMRGRISYPHALGYWPALLLYMALIWIELFSRGNPFTLSMTLLAYTGINLGGAWLVGTEAWFQYGEFFSVYFRMIARMAPVEFMPDANGRVTAEFRLRAPFSGLRWTGPEHFSLLIFVLLMLSSTAFDGLHETRPWIKLYWVDLYTQVLAPWVGRNPFAAYPLLNHIYRYWQSGWLILSPAIYWLLYLGAISLMRQAVERRMTVHVLATRFMWSLLPIVLVYHITHYYTLIQTQGIKIIALASDPFGWGQDWFGTAHWFQGSIVPDTKFVWHVQVALILTGHIISVWVAHLEALRCFGNRRTAVLSQIPMLMLMVILTTAGLWILSQPIGEPH